MGICIACWFGLASGCCVSYHAVAKLRSSGKVVAVPVANVIKVVEIAGNSVGRVSGPKSAVDGVETTLTVQDNGEFVSVGVDNDGRAIYMGWDWHNSALPRKLQSAIIREFNAAFNSRLVFEDAPCGWFGP